MEDKLKAVSNAGENAEKDQAILECIKEVWNLMETRIQSIEKKEECIQSSLASSVCQLNNDESQIKLCENKQMVQQIVLQDDYKPNKNNVIQESVKSKTLAEFVHEAVQSGLKMVDQKQICVEVHSEMTNETLNVFEDMNYYLIRDLPPLIGSSAFETGNFTKHHIKNVVSPVDDIIIELPQPILPHNIPNPTLNGLHIATTLPAPQPPPSLSLSTVIPVTTNRMPLHSPQSLSPSIQNVTVEEKIIPARRGPVIITPSPSPEPSIKSNGNVINAETRSLSIGENSTDTNTTNSISVSSKAPPNLAEIIKNAPAIINEDHKKKQNRSLFDDEEEEPLVRSTFVSKPEPISQSRISPNNILPTVAKETIAQVPELKPRTKLPASQPQAPPRRLSPVSKEKIIPVNMKLPDPKKHKSLFSSSDEEDDLPITRTAKPKEVTEIPSSSKPVAPKRSQNIVKDNITNSTTVSTVTKPEPRMAQSKAKKLFDDSDDEDDDYISKPVSKVVEKSIPKPQTSHPPPSNKVVRKSMFSSSESD